MILSGWFSIVWNERPHFFLTTEDGGRYELSNPEESLQELGGLATLDPKQVTADGQVCVES